MLWSSFPHHTVWSLRPVEALWLHAGECLHSPVACKWHWHSSLCSCTICKTLSHCTLHFFVSVTAHCIVLAIPNNASLSCVFKIASRTAEDRCFFGLCTHKNTQRQKAWPHWSGQRFTAMSFYLQPKCLKQCLTSQSTFALHSHFIIFNDSNV